MLLSYIYDYKIDNPYPDYNKTFTHSEVRRQKHIQNKRYGYMIKEFTIELGAKLYTYTYTHYSNYKKDI